MNKETTTLKPWSWEATSALCCFVGGIAAAVVGSILTALTWIVGGELHPWVRGVGTGFLILTVPLLIFAGYCMDWMEGKRKRTAQNFSPNRDRGNASIVMVLFAASLMALMLLASVEFRSHRTVLNFLPEKDSVHHGFARKSFPISQTRN